MAFICIVVIHLLPATAAAAQYEDGTYSIDYEVLQGNNESVSIANDYFQKPATLTVKNGKQLVEITVNHSEWIQYLKAASGDSFVDVKVVKEDEENDTRNVVFEVDEDISQPVHMQMHIHIASMEPVYDHKYTVRIGLDIDSMAPIDPPPASSSDVLLNEKESNHNAVFLYLLLALLVVASIFLIRYFRMSATKKTKNK